jgi:hypothetical protein
LGFLPTFWIKVTGKATGILFFVGGMMNFLNIPMKDLAVKQMDGDFFVPLICILWPPCIAAAWNYRTNHKA